MDGHEGSKYKSFEDRDAAALAFEQGHEYYLKKYSGKKDSKSVWGVDAPIGNPINESIAVDAACSGNPGDMEYRGVYVVTSQEIFHIGPMKEETNNVGEFFAIVHGLLS